MYERMPMPTDKERGLYSKFIVERTDGRDQPGGDRENARYFVLDYVNDPVAREAVRTYCSFALALGFEKLYDELMDALDEVEKKYGAYDWNRVLSERPE